LTLLERSSMCAGLAQQPPIGAGQRLETPSLDYFLKQCCERVVSRFTWGKQCIGVIQHAERTTENTKRPTCTVQQRTSSAFAIARSAATGVATVAGTLAAGIVNNVLVSNGHDNVGSE